MNIESLVSQMTMEEKVALLAGGDLWHTTAIPRLGIPALKMTDGPIGARGEDAPAGPTSACLPCGSALAATWDVELVEQVGRVLGQETRSKGAQVLLAPTVNIHRSPLAGRNFECYSEDPHLTAAMATAYIRGVQSVGVGACIKHFVCNDSEFERTSMSSDVGERALREIYLRPFERAVRDAQPWAVMSSYNRVNGVYASENDHTLKQILKGEWQFHGIVISDWWGTYSERVVGGGLDVEMPGPARWMSEALEAVRCGAVTEAAIDDKVRRILQTIVKAGLFEQDAVQEPERAEDTPEQRAVARRAAAESIVLVKNDGNVLPLADDAKRIAVIGENATWGTYMGGGSVRVTPHYLVSGLDGIRERAGQSTKVDYAIGCAFHKILPSLNRAWLTGPLTLEYFPNRDLQGAPARTDEISKVNLYWFGTVEPALQVDNFSIRLTATFNVPQDGTYFFSLPTTSQNRLYVDDVLLIDQWHPTPEASVPSPVTHVEEGHAPGEMALKAGETHRLRVEYAAEPETFWRNLRIGAMLKPRPVILTEASPLESEGHAAGDNALLIQDAAALAAQADVAIVFVGTTVQYESEGFDRPDMELPGEQVRLIEAVAAANPKTIVVLNSGAPVTLDWLDRVPAVVHTGFLGQESGHAIADVLFGDVNPCGKLATTWPRRIEDNPAYLNYPGERGHVLYGEGIFVGYRYYDKKKIEPRLVFGHGLSYTQFVYRNLAVTQQTQRNLGVTFEVENTGTRAGKEIAQVYLAYRTAELIAGKEYHALGPRPETLAEVMRPEQELVGFAKVELEPGECRRVALTVERDALAYYDVEQARWAVEPGEYVVRVGASSRDVRLTASFHVAG